MDTYKKRFAAFGWRTLVIDGHDMALIVSALRKARRSKDAPTVILARTFKGHGISHHGGQGRLARSSPEEG